MSGPSLVDEVKGSFEGRLIARGDGGYDDARKVWNGMVDRRPGLIAQCAGTADVVAAVRLAGRRGLPVAVRGGGHNVAGNATCDDGVVVDLRPIKEVTVDADRRIARAGGGVTWAEYDRATQRHGLASPGGAISSTGIAGLTLGGGFGWISRSHGLACDNLVGAEVVTAAGDVLTASADEHPDLFWALRGGGGNFGVVTRFDYRLHPVGELLAGLVLYPRSTAREFLRAFADWTAAAPDQVSSMAAFLSTPDGVPVVGVFVVYNGPAAEGEQVVAPLRTFDTPLLDDIGVKPYTAVQQAFDEGFPAGARNYWKSSYLRAVDAGCIGVLVEHADKAPTPTSLVAIEHMMGGAVARVGADETAFGNRDAVYNLLLLGMGQDRADDGAIHAWARGAWQAVQPFATGGVYVNYMDGDEADRVGAAYGSAHYQRLAGIKRTYDPDNLFRLNQNIVPSA